MNRLTHIAVCMFLLCRCCGLPAEELRIESLPSRYRNMVTADLRIRGSSVNGHPRLALMASVALDGPNAWLFNPFGKRELGNPYRLVLTDSDRKVIHTVVHDSPGLATPYDPKYWVHCTRGGLVGRCFWSCESEEAHEDLSPDDLAVLPRIPPGRYYLYLLVNQRMFQAPPKVIDNKDLMERWRGSWNDPDLDQPACVSVPVAVDVDSQSVYRPVLGDGVDGGFEVLDSDCRVDHKHHLSLIARFVSPSDALLVVPQMNIHLPTDSPLHVSVVREDGAPFDRFSELWSGSHFRAHPRESVGLLVPRNGVIGGTISYTGTLKAPGKYLVTTEIDESIYKDKLFVDGKRVIRKPSEWPIVFRSRTTTITVPEKAP